MITVDLSHPATADDPLLRPAGRGGDDDDEQTKVVISPEPESLSQSFQNDGFVVFHRALDADFVETLRHRLERVLRGEFDRNSPPDKMPNKGGFLLPPPPNDDAAAAARPLGQQHDGRSKRSQKKRRSGSSSSSSSRVLQIINVNKCDANFRKLATSSEIGRMVAKLAGWERGARLAQDQVWAKPPGAPPLVFHRDSPYFMFAPPDVVTVWVALDDMDEELGPLEYVRGSHAWGDGRVGSSSSFFQSENRKLLYSAARLEGIDDPEASLEILSMAGLGAGGMSVHNGKVWHGSGKNRSADRPRRGIGLHFVPAEITFTKDARKSKLWRTYIPDDVSDEDLVNLEISEEHFPLVWKP